MSDVVTVTILDQTKPISKKGFGLPLVFDPTQEVEYKEVEGTDGLTTLTSGDMAYDMISRIFEQEPSPDEVAVLGENIDEGESVSAWSSETSYTTGDLVKPTSENENGRYYEATADGTSGSDEPDWPTTDEATVTDGGVTWQETGFTSIQDALDYHNIEHGDFYFMNLADRTQSRIEETASWAGANEKLFITQPDISSTITEIETLAGNINSSRTGIFAHDGGSSGEDDYLDAAITGRMAPTDPGSATWKFKSLNGVASSTYKNTEVNTLLDANVNTYVTTMGVTMTNEGKETSGGFLDIQRGKDWLAARIEEAIFFLLYNSEKVSYDDPGIAQVVSKLKGVLKRGVRQDVIATNTEGIGLWTISAPSRSEIADNDIANRLLPDINFTAKVAGAVHNVEVEGVLQV